MTRNPNNYSIQKHLIKFFSDWSKLIALVAVALLSIYFAQQPVEHQGELQKYLNSFTQWLPLTLLIWMTKLEVEMKSSSEKLEKHTSDKFDMLYSEINENEKMLIQLWSKFLRFLNDDELDTVLREILTSYSEVKNQNDTQVSNHAKDVIKSAHSILKQREFVIKFGAVNTYPAPFYKNKNRQIIATNVGSISEGFWAGIQDRSHLIKLNYDTIQENRINNTFQIRRVFVLKEEDITNDLHDLMNQFCNIGVQVRYLSFSQANQLADANSNDVINRLEDFTVFIAKDDSLPSYSGRLENLQQPRKMIISSNPQVIEGLQLQFDALWVSAQDHGGSINLSIFS